MGRRCGGDGIRGGLLLCLQFLLVIWTPEVAARFESTDLEPEWLTSRGLNVFDMAVLAGAANDLKRIRRSPDGGSIVKPTSNSIAPYRLDFEYHSTHGEGNTEFSVLYNPKLDHLLFTFRSGSEADLDEMMFEENLKPRKWAFGALPLLKHIDLHSGFHQQYARVRSHVLTALTTFNNAKVITVTGHSVGGAVGTIAAADIAMLRVRLEIQCVTFGSPRPGGDLFMDRYKNLVPRTLRVVTACSTCVKSSPMARQKPDTCHDRISLLPPAGRFSQHVAPPSLVSFRSGFSTFFGSGFETKMHSLASYEEAIYSDAVKRQGTADEL